MDKKAKSRLGLFGRHKPNKVSPAPASPPDSSACHEEQKHEEPKQAPAVVASQQSSKTEVTTEVVKETVTEKVQEVHDGEVRRILLLFLMQNYSGWRCQFYRGF